ncbi:MAG: (2Fe-2S) ferredoxin domain-containing protein [Elusimicrobia bacterium]|nr:(2Fe-2S) ferredoxin domain-containing protein [Elusimicrobiota bacterium]
MKEEKVPFVRTAFVCTNKRADGRPACGPRGGEEICEWLKNEVKRAGLKGRMRVARSGCLDLCEKGPNIFVYPDGAWLSGLSKDKLPEIWSRLTQGDPK